MKQRKPIYPQYKINGFFIEEEAETKNLRHLMIYGKL